MRPSLRTRYSRSWNSRRKQRNVLAAPACGPRHQVHGEIADAQDGLLHHGFAAPAERLDASQQFDKGKWLDEIVVAAGPQAAHAIVDLAKGADDQDRGGDAAVAQPAHDRYAIDVGEHAIDRDHGILARGAPVQRFAAVRRDIHPVPVACERIRQLTGGLRIIFHDQNTVVTPGHDVCSPTIADAEPTHATDGNIGRQIKGCGRAEM